MILCVGMGFAYYNGDIQASDPSITSKLLTLSPLGKDRILALCFVKHSNIETLNQFYKNFNWDEFSERDLVVVEVSAITVSSVLGDIPKDHRGDILKARHHDFGNDLRTKVDCKNDLELILIGKDTGVKARWKNDFTQEKLFNLIDAMPMRRFEMRQRADKN